MGNITRFFSQGFAEYDFSLIYIYILMVTAKMTVHQRPVKNKSYIYCFLWGNYTELLLWKCYAVWIYVLL